MKKGKCVVKLEFNVEDPLARAAASRTVKATDAYLALWRLDDVLKGEAREMFLAALEEYGINLEDLP